MNPDNLEDNTCTTYVLDTKKPDDRPRFAKVNDQRRTGAAYRGWLTRKLKSLNSAVNIILEERNPTRLMEDALVEIWADCKKYAHLIETLYVNLIEKDPSDRDYYGERLDNVQNVMDLASLAYQRAKSKCSPETRGTAATVEAAAPANDGPKAKEIVIKPFHLSLDDPPSKMETWKRNFTAYYKSAGLERQPIEVQQNHFEAYLKHDLQQLIMPKVTRATPVLVDPDNPEGNSCLKFLSDEFKIKYPLLRQRAHLFELKKASGQSISAFLSDAQNRADLAKLSDMTPNDILAFLIFTGLGDNTLKEEILKKGEDGFRLNDMKSYLRELESYKATLKSGSSSGAHHANQTQSTKGKTNFNKGQKSGQFDKSKNEKSANNNQDIKNADISKMSWAQVKEMKLCVRCGTHAYQKGKQCPHVNATCASCKKTGHLPRACHLQKDVKKEGGAKCQQVICSTGPSCPRAQLWICPPSSQPVPIVTVVDSGASESVVNYNLVNSLGFLVSPPKPGESLKNASGQDMALEGCVEILIWSGQVSHLVRCLVSSDLHEHFLLSWHDSKALGLITFSDQVTMPILGQAPQTQFVPMEFAGGAAQRCQAPIMTHQSASSISQDDEIKMSEDQLQKFEALKVKYKDVFSDKALGPPMSGGPAKIILDDPNARPVHCKRTKAIPIYHEKMAKELIEKAIEDGVIEKVPENKPSKWCSKGFFVPKPNGRGLRLVTDYTPLNRHVMRPVHPFLSANQIIQRIPATAACYAAGDMLSGYHQVELDEESKDLTTFLLPWGRFRYRRCPMGLSASGDIFCQRTDAAFEGLPIIKLVDDILIPARDYDELLFILELLLQRCQEHSITMSLSKLQIGSRVSFAGHEISRFGVHPHPKRLEALEKFPRPTDVSSVRSFMGLANQFQHFVPTLSQIAEPIRVLLKKSTPFVWTPLQEAAFIELKQLLTSNLVVGFFDPTKLMEIMTDASRNGLGYAVIQRDRNGNPKLIICGSRSVKGAELHYSVSEIELLAIIFALFDCIFYTKGNPHIVIWTDHRPLLGIFAKEISEIENTRLQRMRLKLVDFNIEVKFIQGAKNFLADAFSRYPVDSSFSNNQSDDFDNVREKNDDDDGGQAATVYHIVDQSPIKSSMEALIQSAEADPEYQAVKDKILSGVKYPKNLPKCHPGRLYANVWPNLSVDSATGLMVVDTVRIVVPKGQRFNILRLLHKSHSGPRKTKKLAAVSYFWPTINEDIVQEFYNCDACRRMEPSLPSQPLILSESKYPSELLGIDPFEARNQTYVALMDHYSGYLWVVKPKRMTAECVIKQITFLFAITGFPSRLRSDGGKQFASSAFSDFCSKFNIVHEMSSAYYPTSNGISEAGVKLAKRLLLKVEGSFLDFQLALAEHNVNVRQDGTSPSDMFFARKLKTQLPMLTEAYKFQTASALEAAELARSKTRGHSKKSKDKHHRALSPIQLGQHVLVQDPKTKLWDQEGTIVEVRENSRSYKVNVGSSIKLRNRVFLKSVRKSDTEEQVEDQLEDQNPNLSSTVDLSDFPPLRPPLRRSTRIQKKLEDNI